LTQLHDTTEKTVLVTGATGYVGGALLPALLERGHRVRALVRHPGTKALPQGVEVAEGDVAKGTGLAEALAGCDVAYYLVHSMGRGNPHDFAARDRGAARHFGRAAQAAGVPRTIYLGGLEDASPSEHLRSRHEVAEILGDLCPTLTYARAAMVIGEGSASFVMLRSLVERLPVMVTPRWVDTRSQPVAIHDVIRALVALAERKDVPAEVQLGGSEVLTYREMMHRYAAVTGRRPPQILPVPVLTPQLSAYWVSLFAPVDASLARPLIEGLSTEMVVDHAPPPGINDAPLGFDDAVRRALGRQPARG
jgi:uncharacterized protein YbjT (DUF2867 family)